MLEQLYKAIAVFIFFFLSVTAYAGDAQFAIVVDGGSSGSRLHLYQYQMNTSLPSITEVFYDSTEPGLSSYSAAPERAGESLAPLLDGAVRQLKKMGIDPHTVTIRVLGTGGMRMLSDVNQAAIYANVHHYLESHYGFLVQEVASITGKMEGVYGWLDVNYLLNHFANESSSLGSIDIGGASTQIAFEANNVPDPDDAVSVWINGKRRVVFSKSFYGLGLDESRKEMNARNEASSCYPDQFQLSPTAIGRFNLSLCEWTYERILREHHITQAIVPIPASDFVAYSGAYHVLDFFGATDHVNQMQIESRLQAVCGESWETIKKSHPDVPEKYLSAYCANGVYIDDLLYWEYHMRDAQVTVASHINHEQIDWTLGALLYELLSIKS